MYLGPSYLGLRIPWGLTGKNGVRAQRHLLGLRQRRDLRQGCERDVQRHPLDDTDCCTIRVLPCGCVYLHAHAKHMWLCLHKLYIHKTIMKVEVKSRKNLQICTISMHLYVHLNVFLQCSCAVHTRHTMFPCLLIRMDSSITLHQWRL